MAIEQQLNYEPLFRELEQESGAAWSADLRALCSNALSREQHGDLTRWLTIAEDLMDDSPPVWRVENGRVDVGQPIIAEATRASIRQLLLQLHPWRKGPFCFRGISIDAEWRSDLKWEALKGHIELRNRSVLDVGCGNGYYGWRMLEEGARRVIGLDPSLLFVVQHAVMRSAADPSGSNFVLPVPDDCLNTVSPIFDVAFSMGVLYHRSSPVDHLQLLRKSLRPGGTVVIETIGLQHDDPDHEAVLVPRDRYARMRNVWFLPTPGMLRVWLQRTGFHHCRLVSVRPTTTAEQRQTDWMTFESLSDFLDPNDSSRTIEGYPAPVRITMTAEKRS